jgi:hypothetical protein
MSLPSKIYFLVFCLALRDLSLLPNVISHIFSFFIPLLAFSLTLIYYHFIIH